MASSSAHKGAPNPYPDPQPQQQQQPPPPQAWPLDHPTSLAYLSRRALPIKRSDGEMLTRGDVQYDLLHHIFGDENAVFTNPAAPTGPRQTFSALYIGAITRSSKCSNVLRDKMLENPAFGMEMAKICLLTNVGRINTTMAFFVEMKTALRTYHPIPSLQKTDGNAQDAPRIKNCLKAALLPSELQSSPPVTAQELMDKLKNGFRPPTSVVNLVFILSSQAGAMSPTHFDGDQNFLELFLPKQFSSADRARVFLWLIHYYHEGPDVPNPYDDDFSSKHRPRVPRIHRLNREAIAAENKDTAEERAWGQQMSNERAQFLSRLVTVHGGKEPSASGYFVAGNPDAPRTTTPTGRARRVTRGNPTFSNPFMFYVPAESGPGLQPQPQPAGPDGQMMQTSPDMLRIDPGPSRLREHMRHSPPSPQQHGWAVRGSRDEPSPPPVRRSHSHPRSRTRGGTQLQHERSNLDQTLQNILRQDPLGDSDDESIDDQIRSDYKRRLSIINQIRGRPPTPDSIGRLPEGPNESFRFEFGSSTMGGNPRHRQIRPGGLTNARWNEPSQELWAANDRRGGESR